VQTSGVQVGNLLTPLLAIAFYIYALFYWLGRGVDRTPDRDRLMTLAGLFVTLIILALSFELLRSG
jgi:hypothetical protein